MVLLRAKESFVASTLDGMGLVVKKDTIFEDTDPVIEGREELFDRVDSMVEDTTSTPGTGRVLSSRSRKALNEAKAQPGTRVVVDNTKKGDK